MSQVRARIRDGNALLPCASTGNLQTMLMDAETEAPLDVEPSVTAIGRALVAAMPTARRTPRAAVERRVMAAMVDDPELRAAVFRFVDVRPACDTPHDLARHLGELLGEAAGSSSLAARGASLATGTLTRRPVAAAAALGVRQMAQRFIIGADARDALPEVEKLWRDGAATTIDLLGEATVTEEEADAYARRCEDTLRAVAAAAPRWPANPLLERDGAGPIPRVNLSVKVSALTPLLRAVAPERGIAGAERRLRHLLRVARDTGAHLHVDMESFDTREAVTELTLRLLSEREFSEGPSAGIVLQAYLTESPQHLRHLLDWAGATPRATPLTIRLVKGAYWDHETVEAVQHGWTPPVFQDRRACDRNYELLSRRLIDAQQTCRVRAAIASHNLRSIAHALAYADATGADVELQVLRGLGDETQAALLAAGRRVRTYCPIGDLVAGMAYLVRRLLENTSNDSFLRAQAEGVDLTTLLEQP
jgi:RHH-type proline utilization regulon transcriptional repressor/proline dehydrogenase/delta 1-pyrroline-5-carboxylate dehydrogenase